MAASDPSVRFRRQSVQHPRLSVGFCPPEVNLSAAAVTESKQTPLAKSIRQVAHQGDDEQAANSGKLKCLPVIVNGHVVSNGGSGAPPAVLPSVQARIAVQELLGTSDAQSESRRRSFAILSQVSGIEAGASSSAMSTIEMLRIRADLAHRDAVPPTTTQQQQQQQHQTQSTSAQISPQAQRLLDKFHRRSHEAVTHLGLQDAAQRTEASARRRMMETVAASDAGELRRANSAVHRLRVLQLPSGVLSTALASKHVQQSADLSNQEIVAAPLHRVGPEPESLKALQRRMQRLHDALDCRLQQQSQDDDVDVASELEADIYAWYIDEYAALVPTHQLCVARIKQGYEILRDRERSARRQAAALKSQAILAAEDPSGDYQIKLLERRVDAQRGETRALRQELQAIQQQCRCQGEREDESASGDGDAAARRNTNDDVMQELVDVAHHHVGSVLAEKVRRLKVENRLLQQQLQKQQELVQRLQNQIVTEYAPKVELGRVTRQLSTTQVKLDAERIELKNKTRQLTALQSRVAAYQPILLQGPTPDISSATMQALDQ